MPKPYDHHVKVAQGPGPGNSLESIQSQNLMGMMSPAGRVQSNARTRQPEPVGASLPEPQPGAASSSRAAGGIYGQPGRQAVQAVAPITGRRMTDEDLLPPAYIRNARPREFWRDTVQPYASAAWNMSAPGIAYNYMTGNRQAVQEGLEGQRAYYTEYLPDAGKAGVNSFLMYDAMERDPRLARNPLQNWAGTSLATGAHALTAAATGGTGNAAVASNASRAGAAKVAPWFMADVGSKVAPVAARAGDLVKTVGGRAMSMVPAPVASVAGSAAARIAPAAARIGQAIPKALYEGAFALPNMSSKLGPGARGRVANFVETGAKGVVNAAGSAFNPLYSLTGARSPAVAINSLGSAGRSLLDVGINSIGRGWGLGNFAQGAETGLSSAGEMLADNPNASFGDLIGQVGRGMAQRVSAMPNTAQAATIPAYLLSNAPQVDLVLQEAAEQGVPVPGYQNAAYPNTGELNTIQSQLNQQGGPVSQAATSIVGAATPFKRLETYAQAKQRTAFDSEQNALNRHGLGGELAQRAAGPGNQPLEVTNAMQGLSNQAKDFIYGETENSHAVAAELNALAESNPQAYQALRRWDANRQAVLNRPSSPQVPMTADSIRRLSQAVDPATMTLLLNDPAMMQALLRSPDQGPYQNHVTRGG
jgi:hypothetical protein